MTQVSIGNRSRSPLRPLSFRMMSRADLMRLPSCWAVVLGGSVFVARFFAIGRFGFPFQMSNSRAHTAGFAVQPPLPASCSTPPNLLDDVDHRAMFGKRRHFQDVGERELRRPCSAYFSKRSLRMSLASGLYLSKKSLRSVRSRSARSRRVRSGALKARWQSKSNGSASGCLAASASSSKSMPRSSKAATISLRPSALAHACEVQPHWGRGFAPCRRCSRCT